MKKRRSSVSEPEEMEINMLPMIDIVFQLLIFFVLTMKFIQLEGELRSYLPKNRGLQQTVATSIDLDNVTVFLDWVGEPLDGYCRAITNNYRSPAGAVQRRHEFSRVQGDPTGPVEYQHPNFNEIEGYIKQRKDSYSGIGFGLPVTVNFSDSVPVQMVVNMVDLCVKLGIEDFALNAQGVD